MVIFFLYSDCDDLPDEGVGGKWMDDVNPEIVDLSVNGSKRHQWKLCQSELEQVKAQGTMQRRYSIQKILQDTNGLGIDSGWDNRKFLLFMATNCRLAHAKCSAAQLYSTEFPHDTFPS
jgi:hypothetical protein